MPIPIALIGAIAATGLAGVGKGVSGAKKFNDANKKIKFCQEVYNTTYDEFKEVEKLNSEIINIYGNKRVEVAKSFERFVICFEKIKNKPKFSKGLANLDFDLPEINFTSVEKISISAMKLLGAGTVAAGIGSAAAGGAVAGTAFLGTASTGTKIALLSGAAKTNATLAALGGGALKAGGLGMAGGTAILGGLAIAPALAVGGLFMDKKGKNSMEEANKIQKEVDKAVDTLHTAIDLLYNIGNTCDNLEMELSKLHNLYLQYISKLEDLVEKEANFKNYSKEEQNLVQLNINLVAILYDSITREFILEKDEEIEIDHSTVNEIISNSQTIRDNIPVLN